MRPINAVFTENSPLKQLAGQVQAHQHLQAFWQAGAPTIIAQNSFAASLNNGTLLVYADSAIVANKLKLTQTSILTQLQQLQANNVAFNDCKVTAIVVKVQVKSKPVPVVKAPRILSTQAANSLANLANQLGDSALSQQLKALASKAK
jgi:hypothetical protein